MIDSNADKRCERNNLYVNRVESFFKRENTLLLSEWKKKIKSRIDPPKCPRCETIMEKYVACEFRCPNCNGLLDCSDDQ